MLTDDASATTNTKTVAIVQSSYIPWKGYFDLMAAVDEFILLDDVQYTRRDWRNRNRVKSPTGVRWLTIPVNIKGRYLQRIDETTVNNPDWARAHWASLSAWYRRAPHFEHYREALEGLYLGMRERRLAEINRRFLETLRDLLGIPTKITASSDYAADGVKSERLLGICRAAGARRYLSGPAARAYLDEELFDAAQVQVRWMSYDGYPEYQQLYPPFDHHVSVLDLLLNVGEQARRYMRAGAL